MKLTAVGQSFPAPSEAIVDPATGVPTPRIGRYLLQALWNRTGGGNGIIPSIALGLAATGNSRADALALEDDWNEVTAVPAGSGVIFPALPPGLPPPVVFNAGASPLNIYMAPGVAIDALAVNAAYVLGAGKMQMFFSWSLTQVRTTQLQIP